MRKSDLGQATVEYILILFFITAFAARVTNLFSDLFRDSMGSVAHTLSVNLTVGVCPGDGIAGGCFFAGYYNGYTGSSP